MGKQDRKGQGQALVEYALLLTLIALIGGLSLALAGPRLAQSLGGLREFLRPAESAPADSPAPIDVDEPPEVADPDAPAAPPLSWQLNGFYPPVQMGGLFNSVKGGATVPLKFELFDGLTELTNPSAVGLLRTTGIACDTFVEETDLESEAAGQTALRYDEAAGVFVYNWKTPREEGRCYKLTLTTADGSSLAAYFKLKEQGG